MINGVISKNILGIGGMGGKSELPPFGAECREIGCNPFGVVYGVQGF